MYGDNITLFDSLVITVFSMAVVFAALWILTYISDVTKLLIERNKKKNDISEKTESIIDSTTIEEDEDEEELVAVITAAIYASTMSKPGTLVVRNIKRTRNTASAWSSAGITDNMR